MKEAPSRFRGFLATQCVTGMLLLGCSAEPKLMALQADPMASLELVDGSLDSRSAAPAGVTLGKPHRARILLRFRPDEIANVEDLRESAVAAAVESGWIMERSGDRVTKGKKELPTGEAELSIYLIDEEASGSLLVVYLEHR